MRMRLPNRKQIENNYEAKLSTKLLQKDKINKKQYEKKNKKKPQP